MTRLVLDKVQRVGAVRLAVIAELRANLNSGSHIVSCHGEKIPRFVLLEDNTELKAYNPNGAPVPLADVEARCPELLAKFRELVANLPSL